VRRIGGGTGLFKRPNWLYGRGELRANFSDDVVDAEEFVCEIEERLEFSLNAEILMLSRA